MHLQYVFYAPPLCHATPKINFYHLKNASFAQVIRPKMPISSDFTKKRGTI